MLFIVCVALAAGGIILSARLRTRYRDDVHSSLLYFQVFICTFGFYGVWGQVVINAYLSNYLKGELVARFTEIAKLLSLPFLVFAWLMLIRLCCGLAGKKCSRLFVLIFLTMNMAGIIALGYFISGENIEKTSLPEIYYAGMNFIFSVAGAYILLNGSQYSMIDRKERQSLAIILFSVMAIQCASLLLYETYYFLGFIFMISFFAGSAIIPFYITYMTKPAGHVVEPPVSISFEEFCKKYDVSPRESDIVREICNGLTNKEISEKLFISLQTVKDHSHRIYTKTNVRSRVQLINLVKGGS